jgi:peptide/nickel transport system substrate-binding protein
MILTLFQSPCMRRSFFVGLAVFVGGCELGIGGGTAGGRADVGGTVVFASAGDADVLFPPLSFTAVGKAVSDVVFDKLAEIGPDLNTIGDRGFTPRLARRWTWARDSLSIAFEIDPRARWHDGRPVRASDVLFSFDVLRDPAVGSPFAGLVASIDSVTVRDSMTAVAWYKKRTPEQFYDFVYQVVIIPEHVYGAVPRANLKTSDLLRRPVGSGRFRFVRWEPGVRLEIAADTANYRGRAKLDRVVWSISSDGPSAAAKLFSGEADFWENLTPDQLARAVRDSTLRVLPYPGLQYAFLGMNLRERRGTRPHPIFGDHAVRRALSMAVDRRAMLRNVFDTVGKISYGPFPRTQTVADTTIELPPYDVARAKALLDSAGWRETPSGLRQKQGKSLEFGILVPQSSRLRMAYAVLLQEQMRGVGATVKVDRVDFPTFQARQEARDFDAAIMAFSTDPGASGTKQYWHSSSAAKGGNNYVGYTNPRFDALLDSAIASFEPKTSKAYARRAYEVLVHDAPAIWLYDVLTLAGMHRRIRTAGLRADGYWAGLADWHIPVSERIARDRVGLVTATR